MKMPKKEQTSLLLVGTKKGAFIFSSTDGRRTWKASGPHFKGLQIYHVAYDKRNKIVLASVNDPQWGPSVVRSTDMGKTWKTSEHPPKFPKADPGESVNRVWQIRPSTEDEPDVIYCGVEPAMLFKSDDKGESWVINEALLKNETRSKWQPGFGGLCLHTILIDHKSPKNLHIGISAVGALNSRDGGESWTFQNKNVPVGDEPDQFPEFGQCVHKMTRHPERPEVIYQQNHMGQFRSDDNGQSWKSIKNNLPSRFGFPIAIDASDPKRVYVAPLEGDYARLSPDGKFAVWSTDNAGKEWFPLGKGFPKPAYFTVLRDGMTSDAEDPCGIYVGMETGQLYASRNQGKTFEKISGDLPPIYSVSASVA
jgi:photosystem II stability/assembly factor-like uncharacterized protein